MECTILEGTYWPGEGEVWRAGLENRLEDWAMGLQGRRLMLLKRLPCLPRLGLGNEGGNGDGNGVGLMRVEWTGGLVGMGLGI